MKEQQPSLWRLGVQLFSRLYHHPKSFFVVLILSYVILLALSYSLGYNRGLSFSFRDISPYVISKTALSSHLATFRSSDLPHNQLAMKCAHAVRPEFVRQTIIDLVYDGTSPYENSGLPSIDSSLQPKRIKRWSSYGAIYDGLIHKVRPKTIIEFNTFSGATAIYMANLTSRLGLNTQILCLVNFHRWPEPHDLFQTIAMPNGEAMPLNQFMLNVTSQNATKSILPVPLSATIAVERLCEWGILGDLIEVDAGLDFHSAWSNINRAYKLLRPGGILFGHNHFTSYNKGVIRAVKLFARLNKFQVKAGEQYWMINTD